MFASKWLIGVAILAVLLTTNVTSYVRILLQPLDVPDACPMYDAIKPELEETILKILHDEKYKELGVSRLSGAVQVDTQVHDNMPDVDEDPALWTQFDKFFDYLKETFPLVHKTTTLHKVNTHGLVYIWEGSDLSLKPLVFMAHQDVVPVQKDTLNKWTYPPFEGRYDGEYLYGRGASDCKNSLIASISALEFLIRDEYVPKRTIVLAFGFDEEISGHRGAKNIAAFLLEKYGKNGLYSIIDEGPGVMKDPMTGQYVAAPATGEKGYVDLKAILQMPGGHSSVPPDHGAIAIMGELAYNIENDPYELLLIEKNPLLHYLQCLAVHSDRLPTLTKKTILRAAKDKVANSKVVEVLNKSSLTKYLIRTSQAIDVIFGGEKNNALPEDVELVVNHRITVGDALESVQDHFASRAVDLAKKYNLNVEAYGKTLYESKSPAGTFIIDHEDTTLESAPVSPSNDNIWGVLAGTNSYLFEDVIFEGKLEYPLITAPSIMPANTDTRYYWDLTPNIYRFSACVLDDFTKNNIHSVDEKVPFECHLQLTAWYYAYVQNVGVRAA